MANIARISKESDHFLHDLIGMTGKSKIEIIEDALRIFCHYERMRLLTESYNNLRENKNAWEEELRDRSELDGTLGDGLDDA